MIIDTDCVEKKCKLWEIMISIQINFVKQKSDSAGQSGEVLEKG